MRYMPFLIRSGAWYTLRRFMVARYIVAVVGEGLFQYLRVRS
jgi:hypothetical protein